MKRIRQGQVLLGAFVLGILLTTPAASCVYLSTAPFSLVNEMGLTLHWGSLCSTGTVQYSQVDDDPAFLSPFTLATFNPPTVFGSTIPLLPNTLYYAQVSTLASMAGSVALGSTRTLANLPLALPVSVVSTTQLQPQWGQNGNPLGTLYEIQTTSDGFTTVIETTATMNTDIIFNGFSPNTTYSFQVRAVNTDGNQTSFVSLGSTATAAEVPGMTVPRYSHLTVQGFRLHWTSGAVIGNPPDTVYEAQLSPVSGFSHGLVSTSTVQLYADFNGLAEGTTYFARVRAVNREALVTSYQYFGSTGTLPFYNTSGSSGSIQSPDGAVRFTVSSGTFAEDYRLVLSTTPILTPLGSPELPSLIASAESKLEQNPTLPRTPLPGAVAEIRAMDIGGAFLSPHGNVEVRFLYPSADGENVDVGSGTKLRARTLSVYRLNEEKALWVRLPSSRVDLNARSVTVSAPGLGVFSVSGQMDTRLETAYAYPVPFRGERGDSAITFGDLAEVATVRVFSLPGRLIKTLEEKDGDGELVWDVRDEEGDPLSSGVYFYLIESPTDKKRGKLVILR